MSNIFTVDNCSGSLVDTTIHDLFIKKHILDNIIINCNMYIKDLKYEHTGKYDLSDFINLLVGILNTYKLSEDKTATFSNINDVLGKITNYIQNTINTSGLDKFISIQHSLKLVDTKDSIYVEAYFRYPTNNSLSIFNVLDNCNITYLYNIKISNKKED